MYFNMYLEYMTNTVSLNIIAVPTLSFLNKKLQVNETTGYVTVCIEKDSNTSTDFKVTLQTLSGTAQGEELRSP